MGISGRIAAAFQSNAITPLLALAALLLGLFAVLVTPREEEPQINVTMANVLIPFPGASSTDVQNMVAKPAEQVLGQIAGIEHTYSVARPGLAILTVQFKVGVARTEALVRLYDVLNAHQDWLPRDLGTLTPIVKPKGIDDVPVAALTLWSRDATAAAELETVAHAIEGELKAVPGVREVQTIGGPGQAIQIAVNPERLRARGVDLLSLQKTVAAANSGMPAGAVLQAGTTNSANPTQMLTVDAGEFLRTAEDVADIVVGVSNGKPVFLRDVANVTAGTQQPRAYVWFTPGAAYADGGATAPVSSTGPEVLRAVTGQSYPAVTLQISKKPGENAVDVSSAVRQRMEALRNTLVPAGMEATVTRDYGQTAADKANKLIQKLAFATGSVILLVGLALGRREALIVGAAVILTLTATLFASWAWGFTLNRVSLFALIFSIGILVDDAIVVVENIHRHQQLTPDRPLRSIIPLAVDEVGGPTILATLTVIAALLPMAFVSGLMGPYMSPIPINSSLGMLISLAIAFTVTPWLALKFMREHGSHTGAGGSGTPVATGRVARIFGTILTPFLNSARKRWLLLGGILLALMLSVGMAAVQWVVLKMLPFDNKSEFQVMVDMPAGTALEDTAATLQELGAFLATQPEVTHLQAYAGTASPITFNGLVRQYYFRSDAEQGDLQVSLVDKHQRSDKSHAIAQRLRPALEKIGLAHHARVKVVEVPPGPPVMSPLVAEVYGPDELGRQKLAAELAATFAATPGVVAVDSSLREDAPRAFLRVRRQRAESLGIPVAAIAQTVSSALSGADAAYLHDGFSKYPVPVRIQLPLESQVGLDALLALPLKAANGQLVPLSALVQVEHGIIDKPLYTKDLKGVSYVFGDMAGKQDSPLYGLFGIRSTLQANTDPAALTQASRMGEYWIKQPTDTYRQYALKWDGESQITYETFRDMGAAYGVGLVLIYLLVVAQFKSYLTPLVIMAPIPLTIIGVMPGHALLGAQYTATSMIGMIALAGIIVRNSILLVDFIELQVREGMDFKTAVLQSAIVRAQPIVLTGLAAMIGAFFILDDPIFNGLAISLIFGILVSTLLTLVVIPVLYYALFRRRMEAPADVPPFANLTT
jgi:multidrug efflux pump subunit AcrB